MSEENKKITYDALIWIDIRVPVEIITTSYLNAEEKTKKLLGDYALKIHETIPQAKISFRGPMIQMRYEPNEEDED